MGFTPSNLGSSRIVPHSEQQRPPLRSALCEYVFDECGCVRSALEPEGGLRGQSIVCRRGNKAMNVGSTMAM